jgi:hypothetical protein
MKIEKYYDLIQVALENINGVDDVITEIRFWHCAKDAELRDTIPLIQTMYVAHMKYDENDELVTKDNFTKDIMLDCITKALGKDQIDHMEKLMDNEISQLNKPKKEYTKLEI